MSKLVDQVRNHQLSMTNGLEKEAHLDVLTNILSKLLIGLGCKLEIFNSTFPPFRQTFPNFIRLVEGGNIF